jgi:2-polyprenyl-3-methyl-5-hydroxy-6-metoxy-1,4-benzoquinol methylase
MTDPVLENQRQVLAYLSDRYRISDLDLSRINTIISPSDTMYANQNAQHYFNVGFSGLKCIVESLHAAARSQDSIHKILDFPCGWGRVLRFIRAYFNSSSITACELDKDGLDFCARQFNAIPLLSRQKLDDLNISEQFDLIWCGSLVTHLDRKRTIQLLDIFIKCLADNGILILTSQGRHSRYLMENGIQLYGLNKAQRRSLLWQYCLTGYGYINYHRSSSYGISLIKPSWLMRYIQRRKDLRLVCFNERFWDDHQDVIACVKVPLSGHPNPLPPEIASDSSYGSAPTLSDHLEFRIPILRHFIASHVTYLGMNLASSPSADGELWFRVTGTTTIDSPPAHENCDVPSLMPDGTLHIPGVLYKGIAYTATLREVIRGNERYFKVVSYSEKTPSSDE